MRKGNTILAGAGLIAAGMAAFAASRLLTRHPVGNPNVPEPAKNVELDRYLGKWFEIARYEQRFERGCVAASAQYSSGPDGKIIVLNRCRKQNGKIEEARGVAKVVDGVTRAKLKVSFFGPFYGNYWILDHADDYSWSIVGEPTGRYLWILSRHPQPGPERVEELIERVSTLGYDPSMLVFDRH